MKYDSIENILYSKRDLVIKVTVANRFKNFDSLASFNKDGAIRLSYRPVNKIIIGPKKSFNNGVMLPLEEFYVLAKHFKKMSKALKLEDMYVLDKDNRLVLNRKLSLDTQRTVISYDNSLIMRTAVVNIDNTEYEGIELIFNKNVSIGINHMELKKLYKFLKKIDIANFALNSAIFGYSSTEPTISQYCDYSRNPTTSMDYYRSTNDNRDILETPNTKGDKHKLWDMN